jgi:DNA-directed RNA polymerase II subunit RPB2
MTGIATVSFLRRINAPLNRLSRMVVPRNVHNTAFGYICPVDTPEGEPVGFLKNLSIMAQVSVEADVAPILNCLRNLKYNPLNDQNLHRLVT